MPQTVWQVVPQARRRHSLLIIINYNGIQIGLMMIGIINVMQTNC